MPSYRPALVPDDGEHVRVIDNVRSRPERTGALWLRVSHLPLSALSAP